MNNLEQSMRINILKVNTKHKNILNKLRWIIIITINNKKVLINNNKVCQYKKYLQNHLLLISI